MSLGNLWRMVVWKSFVLMVFFVRAFWVSRWKRRQKFARRFGRDGRSADVSDVFSHLGRRLRASTVVSSCGSVVVVDVVEEVEVVGASAVSVRLVIRIL